MQPIRKGLFEISEDGSGFLLINECERCGKSFFPRRTHCIVCMRDDCLKNKTLSEIGRLYTYTTVFRSGPHFKVPFMVGYVDFEEEGIRIFTRLTGCKPEELQIGMKMELVFEEMDMGNKEMNRLVYKCRPVKQK